MIIYRFERNGIGPFVIGSLRYKTKQGTKSEAYAERLYNKIKFREPNDWETIRKAHSDKKYIFGCSEKEALRAYFGTSFKILFKQGYRIKKYTAPDSEVLMMGIEVAFPVKYHKLKSVGNVKKLTKELAIKNRLI